MLESLPNKGIIYLYQILDTRICTPTKQFWFTTKQMDFQHNDKARWDSYIVSLKDNHTFIRDTPEKLI